MTAAFAEDNQYLASSDSTPFTVTHKETLLDYTGDTHIANAIPAHLAGALSEDGSGTPIAGRNVTFTLGSGASAQSCTGTTDASGVAGCTIASVSQPLNAAATVPVTAVFSGDPYYQPSTAAATLSLQFLTGRAYGVSADVSLLLANLNLPPQPDTGEVRTATPTSTTTPCTTSLSTPLISADSLCPNVTVTLAPGTSTATSTLQAVTIGIPGLPVIAATAIQSDSTSTCTAATGSVTITNLTVGGVAVNTEVGPNTVINLGGLAKLTLNEQLPVPDCRAPRVLGQADAPHHPVRGQALPRAVRQRQRLAQRTAGKRRRRRRPNPDLPGGPLPTHRETRRQEDRRRRPWPATSWRSPGP